MNYFRNTDGGAVMTEQDARTLWRDQYDGGDPANGLDFSDQFEDVTDMVKTLQARPELREIFDELLTEPEARQKELTTAAIDFLTSRKK